MSSKRVRVLILIAALGAVLTLVGSATAASRQVLLLQVYAGPMSPVDHADVTVTDAHGVIVGTGVTDAGGGAVVRVTPAPWARPYHVRTSGGMVEGKPFRGHVEAMIDRIGRVRGPQWANFVTTAAARYAAAHGGSAQSAQRRLLVRLGLSPTLGQTQLAVPTSRVSPGRLAQQVRARGGYDGLVDEVVARMVDGKPLPRFATGVVARVQPNGRSASTRQTAASPVASAPCSAPLPDASGVRFSEQEIGAAKMAAGMIVAFGTKNPTLLLQGAAGMAFAKPADITNTAMLKALQAQLTCISQQIAQLQVTVDKLTLLTALNPLQNCVASITTNWNNYQYFVRMAAENPDDDSWRLAAGNPNIDVLFDGIKTMHVSTCTSIINQVLFNGSGGTQAAWPTIVSSYEKGTYRSSDSAALDRSSIVELQLFLEYYATLEYQQAVMMTDYYNWKGLQTGKDYSPSQKAGWGGNCIAAPSLANLAPNATTWCQWQQNIVDVWPGGIYTDEVGGWRQNPSTSPHAIGGIAVSAVPANWGYSPDSSGRSATGFGSRTMFDLVKPWWKTWTAANALASYNSQPSARIAAPYQNFDHRQMPKTAALPASQLSGYAQLGPYFSRWLNATYSASDGSLTPCSSCQQWQLLGSDAYTEYNTFAFNLRIFNAPYSPPPWRDSRIGDFGGNKPPAAFMLSRPWVQGGAWPTAPVITTSGTVAATATLTASGCPTTGCTWTITAGAPAGLSIGTTTGRLQWSGSAPGTTATIQVVAANTDAFSAPVTLAVQLT